MKRIHYTDNYLINPTHPVTVNLVGVGGTGSQVLTALARIDHALYSLGHPGLFVRAFDGDIVTESNLGRQLFAKCDTGVNKATVLITRINRFFGLSWEAADKNYEPRKDSMANIIISCVDNVKSRIAIQKHLVDRDYHSYGQNLPYYWLDFGNTQKTGQVILGNIRKIDQPQVEDIETVADIKTIAEMFDLSKVKDDDSGPSCSLAEALQKQDLFINSTLAQIGSALLWKLLSSGSIDYHGAYLNLETMNVNPIKL